MSEQEQEQDSAELIEQVGKPVETPAKEAEDEE